MNCSALSLGPCFTPIADWWQSVQAYAAWIEFGVVCVAILIILGLVQRVFGWGGVVAAMGVIAYAIGYLRGQRKDPFNPVPGAPEPPKPVIPKRRN